MPANKDIHGFQPTEQTTVPTGKNYLLVIGIDQYAHCPKLHNAVKDAQEIVAILKRRFEFDTPNIQELYDQNATKSNIYKAFRTLAEKVTPTDNLVIYFSGHGEYDKLFNIGYWIPIEAEKAAVDQYVPNSEIRNILSAIRSKHTFLMVDSCFSGALFAKGASRNVSLRKERDPSRWGLTAGRNEIVTDGEKGTNSPFAKSIIYQLENTDKPLGVAELCDKVLEVVSANANQTPRGEPLKVEGHEGGQFVFHLKKNEVADWKDASSTNTLAVYRSFLVKYPDGQYTKDAKAAIKKLKAQALWQEITNAKDDTIPAVKNKLRLVNQYVDQYEDQPHYDEALNVGELLEYKKAFLTAESSEYALRRFVRQPVPKVAGAAAIFQRAEAILQNKNRAEEERQKEAAAQKIAEAERLAAAESKQELDRQAAAKKRQEEAILQSNLAKKAEEKRQAAQREKELERQRELNRQAAAAQRNPAADIAGQKKSTPIKPNPVPSFFEKYWKYLVPLALLPFLIWGISQMGGGDGQTETITDVANFIEKDMVSIPAGTFEMGCNPKRDGECEKDETPTQNVTLRGFKMSKYEVTQELWRAVMGSDPPELTFKNCDKCPVEGVSWDDIQDFLKKLNEKTGKRYRLPSEAEWEYAARGGEGYKYAGSNDIEKVAWYGDNSGSNTHPVGKKQANGYGLYDMSGNVWEWCEDTYHDTYKGLPLDGSAWVDGKEGIRVVRGGSWNDFDSCRVAYRDRLDANLRYYTFGFRLIRY